MTDEEFQTAIYALAQGDKNALRIIYQAYVRLIYAVVYDVVGRREDAEDVTSEFFIKLVHIADSFRRGSPHRAWMVRIARNMAIDNFRKNRREVFTYESTDMQEDGNANSVLERADAVKRAHEVENKAILMEDMRQAMKSLNQKEKEIVDMKLLGQLTFQEIADATGRPLGTVTWLYNQGITKLRRCLKEYERE